MKRVKTGISGLDNALFGGIPEGSTVLISGAAGTGKTILCLQYIYNGASKFKEPGVFLTTEEDVVNLKNQLKDFGMNPEPLIKKNLLRIERIDVSLGDDFIDIITDLVKKIKAKRLVIDTLTTLTEFVSPVEMEKKRGVELISTIERIFPIPISSRMLAKRTLYNLMNSLKKLKCTTFVTSELPEKSRWLSRDTVSEFICDGVIVLNYLEYAAGGIPRTLIIRKMRRTNHGMDIYPIEITKKGLVVKKA